MRLFHILICSEAIRQHRTKRFGDVGTVAAAHVDHKTGLAEFLHDLPADAAGRENIGGVAVLAADDGDGGKLPLALGDGLEKCGALSAVAGAVGRVFNVAPAVDLAALCQQRRADGKTYVGWIAFLVVAYLLSISYLAFFILLLESTFTGESEKVG